MKPLFRSKENRKLSGVCGGIATYFKMDPTLVRVIAVFLLFITGFFPLLFIYLILIFLIPDEP